MQSLHLTFWQEIVNGSILKMYVAKAYCESGVQSLLPG